MRERAVESPLFSFSFFFFSHPPRLFSLFLCLSQVETIEADFDPDFLRDMLPRLEWGALAEAAASLGCSPPLQETPPTEKDLGDDSFLKSFHHALLEVCLVEGALVCPETGRKFPVEKGIPNMLLPEDEC